LDWLREQCDHLSVSVSSRRIGFILMYLIVISVDQRSSAVPQAKVVTLSVISNR
jgi:hypothetical protein